MSELYPTKTRLALLQDVADGLVQQHRPLLPDPVYSDVDRGEGVIPRWRKVTSAIRDLEKAGWVELGAGDGSWSHAPRTWRLTDAGRDVLGGAS